MHGTSINRGAKDKKLEGDVLDEMGLLSYYMGNIEDAYKFHQLSIYITQKEGTDDEMPMDYDKFKYDIWLEIEKKVEPYRKKVVTSEIKFKTIPKTPILVPKIYSNFNQESIIKSPPGSILINSARNQSISKERKSERNKERVIVYKSIRKINKFKPIFSAEVVNYRTTYNTPLKKMTTNEKLRTDSTFLMVSPYNRNHFTHLSKGRKKIPSIPYIIHKLRILKSQLKSLII